MNIVLAYHGFNIDSRILATALDHARSFKARLHLVTSMETGEEVPKDAFDEAEHDLEKGRDFCRAAGVDCITSLLETNNAAGEDLVEYACRHQIDEIIIGIRRRSKLGKLLFGSTAQYVILEAPCPVLTVRIS
jgi:nucleotide-binding universal stress UspA family protein